MKRNPCARNRSRNAKKFSGVLRFEPNHFRLISQRREVRTRMTAKDHFVSSDACRSGKRRHGALFALLALSLIFAALPGHAQVVQFAASNLQPLEGPAAGPDTVLVQASGLQGNATPVVVTTDADWITLLSLSGPNSMNLQNGPNRLKFQFTANTGATRSGHIAVTSLDGSVGFTTTVTQSGRRVHAGRASTAHHVCYRSKRYRCGSPRQLVLRRCRRG